MKHKIGPFGELSFLVGTLLLPLGTAMMARGDFGLSVVVVPAYLLSQKIGFLTFGMAEYCLQGVLLVLFCLIMGRFRVCYLFSFFAAFLYGVVLDLWIPLIAAIPLNSLGARVLLYVVGMLVNAFAVSFYFRSYFPPQIYELIVKGLSGKFGVEMGKFKVGYDLASCAVGLVLSLLFFGRIVGIGVGSVVCAFLNGRLISFWCRVLDRVFDFSPRFPAWQRFFALDGAEA
ncbi:MAG: YitT family protein [Oscillospiraceae bacterium]